MGVLLRVRALPALGGRPYVLLHHDRFGRAIYAIGNNDFAARFSGIRVERVKFMLFL